MFWGFRELIDIVIEVVVLKIKLKYIDMEVKYKVDFERIRVQKEFDIVQVKFEVFEILEDIGLFLYSDFKYFVLEFDFKEYVKRFIDIQVRLEEDKVKIELVF